MGRTRTAASELDLEPLEVRVGLQGRVRALLSLALPHVEKMPSVVPLATFGDHDVPLWVDASLEPKQRTLTVRVEPKR